MARVRFEDLGPKVYEDLASNLLSRLHPDSLRIDGSGGDGGRDVQFQEDQGLPGFELKSFTGRMGPAQRRQVKRSLRRAAKLGLRKWTLVVPIDPTPGELEWFDSLRATVPFPIEWRGRTWLDAELAIRPEIARYFLEGADQEVLNLLRDLKAEEAAITSAPHAAERVRRLVKRANELDPHYRFEIHTDGQRVTTTIIPRYRGAELDRPIGVKMTFTFPQTAPGSEAHEALVESIEFGTP